MHSYLTSTHSTLNTSDSSTPSVNKMPRASYQIPKIARVGDPDIHHGTCVTHVPWCMPGSLASDFLWSRWRGKLSRHSRCMRSTQCCVSGKRPMSAPQTWSTVRFLQISSAILNDVIGCIPYDMHMVWLCFFIEVTQLVVGSWDIFTHIFQSYYTGISLAPALVKWPWIAHSFN